MTWKSNMNETGRKATHSSTLAWKIPWTEVHSRLQSMGSRRVRHDWATSLYAVSGGILGSSTGKESACNTGDPGLIPGWGRPPGEGIGYLLQYSWSSLVVQTIKNLPERQETWVWSLSWEYPLEEGMATHSSILAWRIPMGRGAWWATVHGVTKESDKTEQLSTAQHVVSGVRQRENRETKIALPWTNIKNNLLVLILL